MAVGLVAQSGIKNAGFEEGTSPGEAMVLPPGSTAIDGWTVVGGNVSYVGAKWQHSQGNRSIGLPCGGGITQTFETDPDLEYEVRFNMAGDPNTPPAVKSLAVTFGRERRVFTFDTTGRSLSNMGWEPRAWVFAADEATTTLTFTSPTNECSTPALDHVRIISNEIGVRARPDATLSVSRRGASLHGGVR
jgi:choice-of-anchor C domain-containing protein